MAHPILDSLKKHHIKYNDTNIVRCQGCSNHNPIFESYETTAKSDILSCANIFTLSDALVIPNSFIKVVFVKEEYRIQIPFFELLQHSEYHIKIAARIIFDLFNNHSVINPLVDFVMDCTVFKRQPRDSSLQLESA